MHPTTAADAPKPPSTATTKLEPPLDPRCLCCSRQAVPATAAAATTAAATLHQLLYECAHQAVGEQLVVCEAHVGHGAGVVCCQPVCDGAALVGDAVCRNHWVHQHLVCDGAAQQLRHLVQHLNMVHEMRRDTTGAQTGAAQAEGSTATVRDACSRVQESQTHAAHRHTASNGPTQARLQQQQQEPCPHPCQ